MDLSGKGIGDGPTRTVTGRLITVHRDSGSAIDVDMRSVDEIECESATRTDAITCHIEVVGRSGREQIESIARTLSTTVEDEIGGHRGVNHHRGAVRRLIAVNVAILNQPTFDGVSAERIVRIGDIKYGRRSR